MSEFSWRDIPDDAALRAAICPAACCADSLFFKDYVSALLCVGWCGGGALTWVCQWDGDGVAMRPSSHRQAAAIVCPATACKLPPHAVQHDMTTLMPRLLILSIV